MKEKIREAFENFELVWDLAVNDFKTKYIGSSLGIIWAFIQPLCIMLIYWIVFQYGLRVQVVELEVPYVLWFVTGLVPWFFFSDSLSNGTNCLNEYNYLVKKVLFPVEILPIVKVLSSLLVHIVFLALLLFLYSIYGMLFGVNFLQVLYYCVCLFIYSLALTYITSSAVIFFKDLGQIINIILQVGMWACPILWNYSIVPERYRWIVKLNPMYYIVEGYRQSFYMENTFPWSDHFAFAWFWICTIGFILLAKFITKRLKPHFADVL